jgi:polyribonucleotide nucleotidyltransferase
LRTLGEEVVAEFGEEYPDTGALKSTYYEVIDIEVRRGILEDGIRPDGRVPDEIRPLSHQVGFLPRAHGSALFTRGITQVLNVTTLASTSYSQMIDRWKRTPLSATCTITTSAICWVMFADALTGSPRRWSWRTG